jgi:hypothetical protein
VNTGFSSPPVRALDHLFGPIVAMVSLMIFVFLVVGIVLIPPALVLGPFPYKIFSNLGLNLSTSCLIISYQNLDGCVKKAFRNLCYFTLDPLPNN